MSKKTTFTSEFEELSWEQLPIASQQVLMKARKISERAYAPYSSFHVGAAVRLESGEIIQASNQENVSFPVGVCAERLVLGYAGANYPDQAVEELAIVAKRKDDSVWASVSPCGLCRQAINETEMRYQKEISILVQNPDGSILRFKGVKNLLPFTFKDLNG